MSVSVSSFRARHGSTFTATSDDLIQECLDEAAALINATTWGTFRDIGIKCLAAHLLAVEPFGEPARLVGDLNSTIYGREFKRYQKIATFGFRNASF